MTGTFVFVVVQVDTVAVEAVIGIDVVPVDFDDVVVDFHLCLFFNMKYESGKILEKLSLKKAKSFVIFILKKPEREKVLDWRS